MCISLFKVTSTKQLCNLTSKQGKLVGVISTLSQVRQSSASQFIANCCVTPTLCCSLLRKHTLRLLPGSQS